MASGNATHTQNSQEQLEQQDDTTIQPSYSTSTADGDGNQPMLSSKRTKSSFFIEQPDSKGNASCSSFCTSCKTINDDDTTCEIPTNSASTSSPAHVDHTITLQTPPEHFPFFSFRFLKMLCRFLGPGFLIAMAYIDPGNLAADINQGIAAGYTLAWVTFWCSVIGYIIQILAAKLGVTTDRDLAQHCRSKYPPFPRFILWAATELGIIACDMIEVIGGAAALNTLSSGAIPLWAGVLITATSGFATLCLERFGMRLLESVLIVLILVMGGTFGYMFFSTGVNYVGVIKGLAIPHLDSSTINYAVGSIGAIIMPHNLYLHSSLVLTRRDLVQRTSPLEAMRYIRIEAAIALLVALIINIFIIAVFANTFYGKTTIEIGLGNAGEQLALVYGNAMKYIWGIGLFAAANASTVTSTYAGQVVMTGYLNMNVSVWWRTAIVRATTLGPTLLVAILLRGENPSFSGFTEWLNIVQSLVLPFVVIPLLLLTSDAKVMGQYANKKWFIGIMSLIIAFLVGMNGYMAVSFALDQLPDVAVSKAIFGIVFALYVTFVVYLLIGPRRVDAWVGKRAKKIAGCIKQPGRMGRAVDMMEVHI